MTKIEWTDDVWNPVTGCTKVSEGCRNCYAERLAPRVFAGQTVDVMESTSRKRGRMGFQKTKVPRGFTDVRTHPDRLEAPLRWRKPRRVFVNSMSDLFHEDVSDEFLGEVFDVMEEAATHTFQVLTKRPVRMRDWCRDNLPGGFVPNVHLGVSCENQETADERIRVLLQTPAAVRFISAEPLLGPLNLAPALGCHGYVSCSELRLDWVIVGGESGPKARPCDVAWIRSIVEQCGAAQVPVFVKQVGRRAYDGFLPDDSADCGCRETDCPHGQRIPAANWLSLTDRKGGDPSEWPEDLRMRQLPEDVRP